MVILPYRADAVMQSLNGLTGQNQMFLNDTNFTITSNGTAHTLGWSGLLSTSRDGTGTNFSGFTDGAMLFYNGITVDQDFEFFWDDISRSLHMNGEIFTNNLNLSGGAVIAFNSGQPDEVNIFQNNNGKLSFGDIEGRNAIFDFSLITPNADKAFTFPDASGTFSLTSDLDSYVPYTGAVGDLDMGTNRVRLQGADFRNSETADFYSDDLVTLLGGINFYRP